MSLSFSQIRRARLISVLKTAGDISDTLARIVGGSAGVAPGLALLGAGIGGTAGALRGGGNAANDAVQGAATGGLTGAGVGVGGVAGGALAALLAKKLGLKGTTAGATTAGGGLLGSLVGGYAGNRLAKGLRKKEPKEKQASALVGLVGPIKQTKTAQEKQAFYVCFGDRYIVLKGEHRGRIGVCEKHKRQDSTEEYMDEDGAKVTKRKETAELTIKFSDGQTFFTDTPEGQVRSYYGDKSDRDDDYIKDKCDVPCEAKAAAAMDPEQVDPRAKLASIIRRVINGDEGLEQIIQHLKSARSKTAQPKS